MITGPTPDQVATRVALIRRHESNATVIGIYTPGTWLGGTELRVNGERFPVAFCTSALQVSEMLAGQAEDSLPLVLITNVEESQLSLDVIARLASRRLHRIDRWQMVRDLFRARQIDPRLATHGWIADALLQKVPEGGYPPVTSGVLDADTVWTHLCQQYLGLPDGRPDALALIRWSLCAQSLRHYETLAREWRVGFQQRIEDSAGDIGAVMLDALDGGYGNLLLSIGLVCEILFAPQGRTHLGIAQARARLEPYLAGRMLSTEVGSRWFQAAAAVLNTLSEPDQRTYLDRTETLLADLKATEYSALSNYLPSGFDQRLGQFAASLRAFLEGGASLDELEACAEDVRQHAQIMSQSPRWHRVTMALRLARYLSTGPQEIRPLSPSRVAIVYATEGGHIDWARRYLTGGDEIQTLARAYRTLAIRVREQRECQNKVFAKLLADWYKAPVVMEGLLPIEKALSAIVAELAAAMPVLLLVIDAMSYAVFRELSDDLRGHGWIELTNHPNCPLPSLVSTIPSVTETSRASLLAGKVAQGDSASEKRSFATHPDLVSVSRAARPPVLFHKGELVEAGAAGLSVAVRDTVRDTDRKIVGVVLNAVDDHLAKSDQLRFSWTISQFHYLDALLYEARLADRAVIFTSDHGHVLEDGTQHLAGSAEERWRPFSEILAEQEVVFEGPRIEQATGLRRIIAPWSETVRYGQRKQGYHGGATPQEVLVPIGVFATLDRVIAGWEGLPDCTPKWWNPIEGPPTEARSVPDRMTRGSKESPEGQGSLFTRGQMDDGAEPSVYWIIRLLSSSVFAAQRRMAGRRAPSEQHVEAFLRALDQHRYHISRRALAEALGQPDVRISPMLMGLQRLLNVDGYQIITVDEDSGIIELNRQLLHQQFQLDAF
jgi:PglZ domain